MKKTELFVVKPSDDRHNVYKKFIAYLERQGIKIQKGDSHEKK